MSITSIILIFITVECSLCLILTILRFVLSRNNKKSKNVKVNEKTNYEVIMKDLMSIIQYKCYIANQRVMQPLVNKALKNRPLINDNIVNTLSLQITKEILEEMSDSYKSNLLTIYNEDKLQDVILELVYNTVTEMALHINSKSIKRMGFQKTFKSFTKNDIDSE